MPRTDPRPADRSPHGRHPGPTDQAGGVWARLIDEQDFLIRKESPLVAVITHQYDVRGVCVATTETNGNTTRFEFGPDYRSVPYPGRLR